MLNNLTRYDGVAKRRRRQPVKKGVHKGDGAYTSSWQTVYDNEREPMAAKETRNHWHAVDRPAGPCGLVNSTQTSRTGQATLINVPLSTAAYQAREHKSQQHIDRLIVGITLILMREAGKRDWQFRGGDDKIELLSRVVVDSWLMPSRFFRHGHEPIVKVFSKRMDCSPQTWRETWAGYYEYCKGIPDNLYSVGLYQQTGQTVVDKP